MGKHEDLTQRFSTWGSKLLHHTDVLSKIQNERRFQPITVQLAPCEVCDSDCAFCSVAGRPLKSFIPFPKIQDVLAQFKSLGAKSLEITGGGNPLLYRDKANHATIVDVILYAKTLGYNIGIITNSNKLSVLPAQIHDKIDWIRISLIKLDECCEPEDYDFNGYPSHKIGFSYIIYDGVDKTPRLHRSAVGTTTASIEKIVRLVKLHSDIKFVRIAGNCLHKGANLKVRDQMKDVIDKVDTHEKFFIKDIGSDDGAFNDGCYVGMVRPYIAPSPEGDAYYVYICTSHVLNTRTYDPRYALCRIEDVVAAWNKMNIRFQDMGYPYDVDGNEGREWCDTCQKCYYSKNNELLHIIAKRDNSVDKNFP